MPLITNVQTTTFEDIERLAWDGLRQHRNTEWVAEKLIRRHSIPRNHWPNARKQAQQIRYCLDQAFEYYEAARGVSLSTRPVLLYYATLSLATAEVLYKQTGESSLDRARAEHRHHGLIARVIGRTDGPLNEAANSLLAYPLIDNGNRKGTFELWHRSARHLPIVGLQIQQFAGARHGGYGVVAHFRDGRLPVLPEGGISFAEILKLVPGMREPLPWLGVASSLCRGEFQITTYVGQDRVDRLLVIHPTDQETFSKLSATITMSASLADRVQITESPGSLRLFLADTPDIRPYFLEWPNGMNTDAKEVALFVGDIPVNEFGLFYLGLFITGNFARYFPDLWIKQIEAAQPLSHAVDRFVTLATVRLPVLIFSELSETLWLKNVPLP